jgi:hypothetical protein
MKKMSTLLLLGIYIFITFLMPLTASDIEKVSMKFESHGGGGGGSCGGLGRTKGNQTPKGGHQNNARPSSKEKHERADARRQREQKKSKDKKKNKRKDKKKESRL